MRLSKRLEIQGVDEGESMGLRGNPCWLLPLRVKVNDHRNVIHASERLLNSAM